MQKPETAPYSKSIRDRLVASASRLLNGCKADAEDMVQDAYLKLQLQDSRTIDAPAAWMFKVTKYHAIDRIRRQQRERQILGSGGLAIDDSISDPRLSPESVLIARQECLMALRALIASLEQTEVALWLLHEVFDWNYEELAVLIGKTESTTRQILHRSRRRFNARVPPELIKSSEEKQQAAEALLRVCLHAIGHCDAEPLRALIAAPPAKAACTAAAALNKAAATPTIQPNRLTSRSTLVQVNGQFALALTIDGVAFCTLPLGPVANQRETEEVECA